MNPSAKLKQRKCDGSIPAAKKHVPVTRTEALFAKEKGGAAPTAAPVSAGIQHIATPVRTCKIAQLQDNKDMDNPSKVARQTSQTNDENEALEATKEITPPATRRNSVETVGTPMMTVDNLASPAAVKGRSLMPAKDRKSISTTPAAKGPQTAETPMMPFDDLTTLAAAKGCKSISTTPAASTAKKTAKGAETPMMAFNDLATAAATGGRRLTGTTPAGSEDLSLSTPELEFGTPVYFPTPEASATKRILKANSRRF